MTDEIRIERFSSAYQKPQDYVKEAVFEYRKPKIVSSSWKDEVGFSFDADVCGKMKSMIPDLESAWEFVRTNVSEVRPQGAAYESFESVLQSLRVEEERL